MWLIAVDEAGYGPKLGPLVVAATAWQRSDIEPVDGPSVDLIEPDPFASVAAPASVGDGLIRVDDSKQVFKGGSLTMLQRIVSVALHACGRTDATLVERLPTLLPRDFETIRHVPWLATIGVDSARPLAFSPVEQTRAAVKQWGRSPWKLRDCQARMIDAESFNRYCAGDPAGLAPERGGLSEPTALAAGITRQERHAEPAASSHKKTMEIPAASAVGSHQTLTAATPLGTAPRGNKSDLLGETSITLAADLLDAVRDPESRGEVQIFFDRHGGRRYYAGVIQQFFGGENVKIVSESPSRSVYETTRCGVPVRLHFTVKGDRFPPVALSSLHAKYLRELAMAALNEYFRAAMKAAAFRPTAGYPVDADRFIDMVRPIMAAQGITDAELIRCR